MKLGAIALTLGLGAAAGAVSVLMLPRQNPARKLASRAAATVEDAVSEAADRMLH